MKPRRLLAPFMAMLLLIPAATAYGADQTLEVTVFPAGTLTVEVDAQGGFGATIPGATVPWGFNMQVTNLTSPATGWVVTVDADGDFLSGNWQYCDQSGCHDWQPDGGGSIPISSLSIAGGDLPWWDDHDTGVIVPVGGTFGSGAVTVNTGTAEAYGSFGINEPSPMLTLSVPGDTPTGLHYLTTLTYTINAAP